MEGFTKTFQRQTALNPEHKNLLISILVGNLPDIKSKLKIVWLNGWNNLWCHISCNPIIWGIKSNCLYHTNLCKARNVALETIQSQLSFLTITLTYSSQKAYRYCKNSGLRKQESFLEAFAFFPCAFEM